jgi:hypothetical protein
VSGKWRDFCPSVFLFFCFFEYIKKNMELLSENNVQEVKKTEAELGQEIKEPEQDIKNSIDELKKDYTLSNDSNELNDFIKQKTNCLYQFLVQNL